MRRVVELCKVGIAAGESPFAALVAGALGEVVCATHNTVRSSCDATAHAEINAIRGACRELGTIDLAGHVIVSTCEPCPMCAAAIHWAGLEAIIYGASIDDAQEAGFNELSLSCGSLYGRGGSPTVIHPGVLRAQCKALFGLWRQGPNPTPY